MEHQGIAIVDGSPRRRDEDMPAGVAFFFGLMVGAFALWMAQKWAARKVARALHSDQPATTRTPEVRDLKDRVATLEAIITDKSHRLTAEIETLR